MVFFTMIDWSVVFQIVTIDLLLGGDNAIVIALACRNLPSDQRFKGILCGIIGAIVLRGILAIFAVSLLDVPFLKCIGGLLLFWAAYKLITQDEKSSQHVSIKSNQLWSVIRTIIIADVAMSVDNIIAIVGATEKIEIVQHRFGYILFGFLVSIPLVISGSRVILFLIDQFPILITFGAGLLGWIIGHMFCSDPGLIDEFGQNLKKYSIAVSLFLSILIMLIGEFIKINRKKKYLKLK